jgi:hypothetical protein
VSSSSSRIRPAMYLSSDTLDLSKWPAFSIKRWTWICFFNAALYFAATPGSLVISRRAVGRTTFGGLKPIISVVLKSIKTSYDRQCHILFAWYRHWRWKCLRLPKYVDRSRTTGVGWTNLFACKFTHYLSHG